MQAFRVRSRGRGGVRCPFCHAPLDSPVWICRSCGTSYHRECANEVRRCALLGCGGVPGTVPGPVPGRPLRRAALTILSVIPLLAVAGWLTVGALMGARRHGNETSSGALRIIATSHSGGERCWTHIDACQAESERLDYGTLSELTPLMDPPPGYVFEARITFGCPVCHELGYVWFTKEWD